MPLCVLVPLCVFSSIWKINWVSSISAAVKFDKTLADDQLGKFLKTHVLGAQENENQERDRDSGGGGEDEQDWTGLYICLEQLMIINY